MDCNFSGGRMRLQGFVVILVLILCMSATTDAATWPEIPESD